MVHCIAEYYGLHSWSATEEGHPRIRYTCVAKPGPGAGVMPKPLYSML